MINTLFKNTHSATKHISIYRLQPDWTTGALAPNHGGESGGEQPFVMIGDSMLHDPMVRLLFGQNGLPPA